MEVVFDFSAMRFFSLFGMLAVILPLIPNFFFAKKEHIGKVEDIDTCGAGICMLEVISRGLLSLFLICLRMPRLSVWFAVGAGIALIVNYYLWIRYFKEGCYYPDIYLKKFLGVPIPVPVFNVTYFIFISLWLGNIIALGLSLVYGICYILNSLKAMQDLRHRVYR